MVECKPHYGFEFEKKSYPKVCVGREVAEFRVVHACLELIAMSMGGGICCGSFAIFPDTTFSFHTGNVP